MRHPGACSITFLGPADRPTEPPDLVRLWCSGQTTGRDGGAGRLRAGGCASGGAGLGAQLY